MSARYRIQLITATTTAALAAAFTPFTPAALAAETSEFTISNVTDFHGYCCLLYTSDAADDAPRV